MASVSTLAQLKHRQVLYGVSTRLSQENVKDMMYLAGIEQQLQESISSGTDVFTILEQRGLLGQHNYTHLISLLETIGRIDLIKTVCSDHQAPAVVALPPDKFSVAEQLAVMKRAQILQKRELYLHSMQKLDVIYNSTSIHQQVSETLNLQILSLLKISEADLSHTSLQPLNEPIVHSLLSSAALFCTSATTMFHVFLFGDSRECECLAVLCRQHWNEFCSKVPKDYARLQQIHSMDDMGGKLIWITAKESQQSLHEVFSELLGSHAVLTAADASFNEQIINDQSHCGVVTYLLAIIKWLIQLLPAVKRAHLSDKTLQGVVLTLASAYRKGIVENADEIASILGLDSLEDILNLIPINNTTFTSEMIQSNVGLLYSTCLALLVQETMSNNPQTEVQSLKSVLPTLCKALITDKEKKSHYSVSITKQLVSNIQREVLMYKSKCEQVIETMTGSLQSADILRSLFRES